MQNRRDDSTRGRPPGIAGLEEEGVPQGMGQPGEAGECKQAASPQSPRKGRQPHPHRGFSPRMLILVISPPEL